MSDFTITNGLINVGGILTETKVRKTRATPEALQSLGLDPTREYKSSIGIASVQEYIVMWSGMILAGSKAVFDLSTYEQPLLLKSVYTSDPNRDEYDIEAHLSTTGLLSTRTILKNQSPLQLPDIPLPSNSIIKLKAKHDISYSLLVFVPCDIINIGTATYERPVDPRS